MSGYAVALQPAIHRNASNESRHHLAGQGPRAMTAFLCSVHGWARQPTFLRGGMQRTPCEGGEEGEKVSEAGRIDRLPTITSALYTFSGSLSSRCGLTRRTWMDDITRDRVIQSSTCINNCNTVDVGLPENIVLRRHLSCCYSPFYSEIGPIQGADFNSVSALPRFAHSLSGTPSTRCLPRHPIRSFIRRHRVSQPRPTLLPRRHYARPTNMHTTHPSILVCERVVKSRGVMEDRARGNSIFASRVVFTTSKQESPRVIHLFFFGSSGANLAGL